MDDTRFVYTRSMDVLGRFVLPMELRRRLDLKEGDSLDVGIAGDTILIKKHEPCCFVCKSAGPALKTVKEKYICAACVALIEQ